LGSGPDGSNQIKAHKFFKSINWAKLERGEVPSIFKPTISNTLSVGEHGLGQRSCGIGRGVMGAPTQFPNTVSVCDHWSGRVEAHVGCNVVIFITG
jgi:hypothetical protein